MARYELLVYRWLPGNVQGEILVSKSFEKRAFTESDKTALVLLLKKLNAKKVRNL